MQGAVAGNTPQEAGLVAGYCRPCCLPSMELRRCPSGASSARACEGGARSLAASRESLPEEGLSNSAARACATMGGRRSCSRQCGCCLRNAQLPHLHGHGRLQIGRGSRQAAVQYWSPERCFLFPQALPRRHRLLMCARLRFALRSTRDRFVRPLVRPATCFRAARLHAAVHVDAGSRTCLCSPELGEYGRKDGSLGGGGPIRLRTGRQVHLVTHCGHSQRRHSCPGPQPPRVGRSAQLCVDSVVITRGGVQQIANILSGADKASRQTDGIPFKLAGHKAHSGPSQGD